MSADTHEFLKDRSKNLAYEVTSILRCEDEPIAFCGAVQPGGLILVICCDHLTIKALSQNWNEVLSDGRSARELLGKTLYDLAEVNGDKSLAGREICELIAAEKIKLTLPGVVEGVIASGCHRQGDHLILEFELLKKATEGYPVASIKDLVHSLKGVDQIEIACQHTAEAIQKLSKFDRVMIYRFDPLWNGEVIAEKKVDDFQSWLGLKYPASDIPPQARQMFLQNKSRMIIDVEAEASPIITSGFHPGEIDLSGTFLRAVSPIHLQYLSNMGVRSSFSAPIRVNDKLWGLIACHHYSSPVHPDQEVRSAFELASQIVSGKISDLVARRRLQIKNETLVFTQNLLAEVASGKDTVQSFTKAGQALLDLTESTSVYVKLGEDEVILGARPSAQTLDQIRLQLGKIDSLAVWSSDCLSQDLSIPPDPVACGALAVPFSLGFQDSLVWFRKESVQEIRWGGKPEAKEKVPLGIQRLTPRSSFAEWTEKRENHSRPWTDADAECAQYFLFGFVQGIFAKAQDLALAYQELEKVTRAKDEFISTVSHELRTPLGIITGWIEILKEYPQVHPEAQEAVAIIDRNARMQIGLINDLLDVSRISEGKLRLNPQPQVDVSLLVSDLMDGLKPTADAKSIQLHWENPQKCEMTADPDRLRQIVWNLLTNAIKFTPKGGNVSVSLRKHDSSCELSVSDDGLGIDPSKLVSIFERFVQAKTSSASYGGLGLGLSIVKALTELHGGSIRALSAGEGHGSTFIVSLPVYALTASMKESKETPKFEAQKSTRLNGLVVLIAEDQPESQRALKIYIERNGASVLTADSGKEALVILKSKRIDLILSDVGMPEMDGNQMILAWREEEKKFNLHAIPAVALTAYASSKDRTKALASGFQSHIPKPVDREELMAVIQSLGVMPRV